MINVMKSIAWVIMTLLALLMVLIASRYFTWNPDLFFEAQRDVYLRYDIAIMTHIIGGVIAMMLGPFQFLTRLRERRKGLHRALGRLYLLGVIAGALGGFFMAFHAYAGITATLGFASLAVVWMFTAVMAYLSIRKGNVQEHRQGPTNHIKIKNGQTSGFKPTVWIFVCFAIFVLFFGFC